MSIKVTVPNNSSDSLIFGSANTTNASQVTGIDSGSSNGQLAFYTTASGVSTERMRIDSSGNVGIGTSSPANYSGYTTLQLNNATNGGYLSLATGGVEKGNLFTTGSDVRLATAAAIPLVMYTNNTERMRIDSSGNLLVGTTTSPTFAGIYSVSAAGSGAGTYTSRNTGGTATRTWNFGMNSSDAFSVYGWTTAGVFQSGVYINWGATSWTGNSDENLKNITGEIKDGLSKVCSLRAAEFTWKSDKENKPQVGLIAQDVQKVLPEVIDTNSNGDLGVRYTEVIPLLVASIKELKAEVDSLKSELATLKGQA